MRIIRRMTPEDVNTVSQLEREIFTDAWTKKGIVESLEQSNTILVVCEEEKQIIGYCIVYCVLDEGEIVRIAVDLSKRSQGIGQQLLTFVEQLCRDKSISTLLLDVRQGNDTARKFYECFGFQLDGIRKNFYEGPKEDAILMSKRIG